MGDRSGAGSTTFLPGEVKSPPSFPRYLYCVRRKRRAAGPRKPGTTQDSGGTLRKTGPFHDTVLTMKTIQHIDSYPADSSIVRRVISVLYDDLRSIGHPQEEIDEIVISMDEALTNAIQETIRTQESIPIAHPDRIRAITVRYLLDEEHFEATIIDHGGGFDLVQSFHDSPSRYTEDYFGQLVRYIDKSESGKLRVTVNGRELSLKGIGAGLKILLAFMDSITIDLMDRKDIISDSVTEFTDGTILTISRKRRYR